jgi:hypothetical protein
LSDIGLGVWRELADEIIKSLAGILIICVLGVGKVEPMMIQEAEAKGER